MELQGTKANRPTLEKLINSIVVPRPIAWVTSVSGAGIRNLSPFSFYQVVSVDPVIVMISFTGEKDSYLNIVETGEFVVNSVTADVVETAVKSSVDVHRDVDEIGLLGLPVVESARVSVPRLSGVRASIECRLHSTIRVGTGHIVFGEVIHMYIDDDVLDEDGRVDLSRFAAVGRMGSNYYSTSDNGYSLNRPTQDADWLATPVPRCGNEGASHSGTLTN
jgi:flavin reductase (DIM6/NTAB) family NADH-FMN oxidoreductase RutF